MGPVRGVAVALGVMLKLAVTFFGPSILRDAGLAEPDRFPDQLEKM
jgi:hypothetical protein